MLTDIDNLLLVGMNRLPFEITAVKEDGKIKIVCKDSPGGLASALEPLKRTHNAIYIGWIGKNDIPKDEEVAILEYCKTYNIIPVFLTEEECQLYYGDFANRELWPIFHGLLEMRSPSPLVQKQKAWQMYQSVNTKFAKAYADYIVQNNIKNPRIWLHDYHLILCAREIVKELVVVRQWCGRQAINIGFFSHIPTPKPEHFMQLNDIDPNIASHLISGLLFNNYCGFQTRQNAHCFAQIAEQLGFAVQIGEQEHTIQVGQHVCVIGANPISIEPGPWIENANRAEYDHYIARYFEQTDALLKSYQEHSPLETAESKKLFLSKIDAIHQQILHTSSAPHSLTNSVFNGERKLIISVQRADYTKGMPEQLQAYALFLEKNPDLISKVSFIFVAVPSRSGLDEFDQTFKTVLDQIQMLRERFGSQAVQFSSGFDKIRLARLYRKADLIWVNSLADGMNLVAKEAVICQTQEHPAQLLLGESVGAAEALYCQGMGAFLVNPRNLEATADTLKRALDTPAQEAVKRLHNMQQEVFTHDIALYTKGFLDAQNRAHQQATAHTASSAVVRASQTQNTQDSTLGRHQGLTGDSFKL